MTDPNIWTALPARDDGFVPYVRRRWMFVGTRCGQQCRFPCHLIARHPSLPQTYSATAVCAENTHYLCDEWVRLDELE
jgi:hypothetical protein